MSTLRISDAPLLPDVDGTEKIPTGGRGDYTITVDQIKDHIFQNVGKELVGLGNVDNTSDLDKPVSTAQQAALDLKADKTYVDTNLSLKADKTNVYTRSETTLALSNKADLVGGLIPSSQLPSYVDDVVEVTTSTLPIIGESGKIYVTTDTNRTWRWSGNQYVEINNGGISDATLKLQTPRNIANVSFDGTQDISIPHNNLTNRNTNGAHTASSITDISGTDLQTLSDNVKRGTANKFNSYIASNGGYAVGDIVLLNDGTEVISTVASNIVDPNANMIGWEYPVLPRAVIAPDLPKANNLRVVAGSIRNTGDGWKWISDSAHNPIGVTPTITVSGVNIQINYGFTAKKVTSLVATPDETFAGLGFIVGGSVGTNYTNLQIKAPLSFTVDTESGLITSPSYVANAISAVRTSGVCTVTHPTIGITGDAPVTQPIGSSSPIHTDVICGYGSTQTILNGVGDLDGQIAYNGTTWAYTGEVKSPPTMSWVTGGVDAYLRVEHAQTDVFNINIQSKTVINIKVISVSGTEFRLRFYGQDGSLLLLPTTDMQFLFSRKAKVLKTALRGIFSVRRGYAGTLPADLVSATGNIWIFGVMEV